MALRSGGMRERPLSYSRKRGMGLSGEPNKGPGAKEEMEKIHSAGNRHDCSHEEDSQIQGDLIWLRQQEVQERAE